MNPIIKAMLIPFICIAQATTALLIIVIVIFGIYKGEYYLWCWSWKIGLAFHIVAGYVIAVAYAYDVKAKWWPN